MTSSSTNQKSWGCDVSTSGSKVVYHLHIIMTSWSHGIASHCIMDFNQSHWPYQVTWSFTSYMCHVYLGVTEVWLTFVTNILFWDIPCVNNLLKEWRHGVSAIVYQNLLEGSLLKFLCSMSCTPSWLFIPNGTIQRGHGYLIAGWEYACNTLESLSLSEQVKTLTFRSIEKLRKFWI